MQNMICLQRSGVRKLKGLEMASEVAFVNSPEWLKYNTHQLASSSSFLDTEGAEGKKQ